MFAEFLLSSSGIKNWSLQNPDSWGEYKVLTLDISVADELLTVWIPDMSCIGDCPVTLNTINYVNICVILAVFI